MDQNHDIEQTKVLAMYAGGEGLSTISDELDVPLVLVEQYVDEFNSLNKDDALLQVLKFETKINPNTVKTNLVVAADWLVTQSIGNADNEVILNKLGRISIILKNASDLVAANLDSGGKEESKYGRFFKN